MTRLSEIAIARLKCQWEFNSKVFLRGKFLSRNLNSTQMASLSPVRRAWQRCKRGFICQENVTGISKKTFVRLWKDGILKENMLMFLVQTVDGLEEYTQHPVFNLHIWNICEHCRRKKSIGRYCARTKLFASCFTADIFCKRTSWIVLLEMLTFYINGLQNSGVNSVRLKCLLKTYANQNLLVFPPLEALHYRTLKNFIPAIHLPCKTLMLDL